MEGIESIVNGWRSALNESPHNIRSSMRDLERTQLEGILEYLDSKNGGDMAQLRLMIIPYIIGKTKILLTTLNTQIKRIEPGNTHYSELSTTIKGLRNRLSELENN